jgi:hypothetical protein
VTPSLEGVIVPGKFCPLLLRWYYRTSVLGMEQVTRAVVGGASVTACTRRSE